MPPSTPRHRRAAGVARVQFVLTGGTYTESVIGTATPSIYGFIYIWNTTSVPGGTYTLQSLVTDKDATTAYSAGITVTVDNTAPTTAVIIPSTGAAFSGTSAIPDATASASAGVAKVQFELTGGAHNSSVVVTATPTLYGWLTEWDRSTVANGTYSVQSIATSSGGQTRTSPAISVTVNNSQATIVATKNANIQEADASYDALQSNLYLPNITLYQGLPSNSCGTYSCLWPFTNATAGTVFLYGVPGAQQFLGDVDLRLTGLGHYADAAEVSPTGASQPPAYESAVAPPLGPGGATYYDDNAWVGLNLVHAYLLTSNPTDLTLAQDDFNFDVAGWDTSATDTCPGGVFWEDTAGSQRNVTANDERRTGQGALSADWKQFGPGLGDTHVPVVRLVPSDPRRTLQRPHQR